jgi:hypothetical protein
VTRLTGFKVSGHAPRDKAWRNANRLRGERS